MSGLAQQNIVQSSNPCFSRARRPVRPDAGTKLHRTREIRTCDAGMPISVERAVAEVSAPRVRFDPYLRRVPELPSLRACKATPSNYGVCGNFRPNLQNRIFLQKVMFFFPERFSEGSCINCCLRYIAINTLPHSLPSIPIPFIFFNFCFYPPMTDSFSAFLDAGPRSNSIMFSICSAPTLAQTIVFVTRTAGLIQFALCFPYVRRLQSFKLLFL